MKTALVLGGSIADPPSRRPVQQPGPRPAREGPEGHRAVAARDRPPDGAWGWPAGPWWPRQRPVVPERPAQDARSWWLHCTAAASGGRHW